VDVKTERNANIGVDTGIITNVAQNLLSVS